jgi:phosphate-selective porin
MIKQLKIMRMKTKKSLILSTLFTFAIFSAVFAQETNENPLPTIVEQLQSDNDVAKRLKITGYVQMQYQSADTAGVSSFAGGNFGSGIDNRFTVRRGRVKFAYTYENALAVMQFDLTEKGLGIKDAYVSLTEPIFNTLSITGGVFDRPFGYEISYSSSSRETPERSRLFQTLFPGERDLGAKITLQAPKTSTWNFLKIDLGLFDGNGTNVETDGYKDFIGHIAATKSTADEKLKWGIGASYYTGGFAAVTTKNYSMSTVNGVKVFVPETVNKGDRSHREYYGLDGQLSYDWAPGITQIRAEYITGSQPGSSSSSSSLTAAATSDVYNRDFNGYYVYFIQNILQSPFQAVVKYDVYDPNTKISGDEIGKSSTDGKTTGSADVKYSTLGLGLNYRFNSNMKIMAYYDIVKNETTSKIATTSTLTDLANDRRDNVFTLRLQYKF